MEKLKYNEYKISVGRGAVIATCRKTRAKCPLIPQFAQRPGHLVSQQEQNGVYECAVVLHGAPELKKQALKELRQTVTTVCQLCKTSKVR